MVTRGLAKQLNGQQLMLIRRISYVIVLGGFLLSAFRDLSPNSDLSILLGAAGVFSVAIGFASQTSRLEPYQRTFSYW